MGPDKHGVSGNEGSNNPTRDGGDLSIDTCLDLLANRRRRRLLRIFLEQDSLFISIDGVVNSLASDKACNTGKLPDHNALVTQLFHNDLPKLADAGVLEFDIEDEQILFYGDPTLEGLADDVEKYG